METQKPIRTPLIFALLYLLPAALLLPLMAADTDREWSRELKDRAARGTLEDISRPVRGDTGKWRDEDQFVHVTSLSGVAVDQRLDDRLDELLENPPPSTTEEDHWLIFRTQQLDDHDRLWVERIERKGNQFTLFLNRAIWQGHYQKNFTWYQVTGVNLGRLPPGDYEAKVIIRPMEFTKFEGDGKPRDNWPRDERPAEKAVATTASTTFAVKASSSPDAARKKAQPIR